MRHRVKCRDRRALPERSGRDLKVRASHGPFWDEEESWRPEEATEEKASPSVPAMLISNHPAHIIILFDFRPEIVNSSTARSQAGVINKQSWPGHLTIDLLLPLASVCRYSQAGGTGRMSSRSSILAGCCPVKCEPRGCHFSDTVFSPRSNPSRFVSEFSGL